MKTQNSFVSQLTVVSKIHFVSQLSVNSKFHFVPGIISVLIIFLFLISCGVVLAQEPASDSIPLNKDSLQSAGMDELLNRLLLTREDFTFRDDYTDKDPYRLKIIDSLMAHPLLMEDFAENLADDFQDSDSIFSNIGMLNSFFEGKLEKQKPESEYDLFPDADDLRVWIKDEFSELYKTFANLKMDITDSHKEFITSKYKELILDVDDYRIYSNEQLDSIQQIEEELTKQFAASAQNIKTPDILNFFELFEHASNAGDLFHTIYGRFTQDEITGEFIPHPKKLDRYDITVGDFKIAFGTFEDDIYRGDYLMIIDPGGNDSYYLTYDIDNPHPTVILDYAGDDYYSAQSDFALASGALSYSILIDYEGDDIYRGKNFSLGCGYFGIGLLWDKKGNDSYFGDTFTQGAGTFGIGLLIDNEGSDTYSGNLYCQGMGFVRGIGGLVDHDGNDSYIVQPKYKEFFHPGNHYQSLSQGFAIGLRPHMSGGFGFICDYGGNDSYVADFFAQGSSYWWSLGLIYDKSGNDLYSSYQYAQGAGAHMSLGMLLDCDGDDVYRSHGVCQGCGHDYSCGWLLDRGGDDIYSANGLAQGAGQANGIGLFFDLTGNDGYYVFTTSNTQGYGNPRRDYGSIGMFLDLDGDDRYDGNGTNDQYWKTNGKWGGGLDRSIPKPDSVIEKGENK